MMRTATISAQKKLGRKTVVVLPFHYPRELFTAMDVHTVELWGPPGPEGSAARAYVHVLLNRDLPYKLSIMKRLCREYDATGAIFHSDRSCKPYSIGQIDLKGRLSSKAGDSISRGNMFWPAMAGRARYARPWGSHSTEYPTSTLLSWAISRILPAGESRRAFILPRAVPLNRFLFQAASDGMLCEPPASSRKMKTVISERNFYGAPASMSEGFANSGRAVSTSTASWRGHSVRTGSSFVGIRRI